MYLPCIRFNPYDFPADYRLTGEGHGGFNLSVVNPSTFTHTAGYLTEEGYNAFMELADSYGMKVHHIATRWGIHIPNKPDIHCVIFYYNGRFGHGYAVAFRKSDGFADLWYVLFDEVEDIPF